MTKRKRVPILTLICRKWNNFMHRSGVWLSAQINSRLRVGQNLAFEASREAENLAHEVQNGYLIPWVDTSVSDEMDAGVGMTRSVKRKSWRSCISSAGLEGFHFMQRFFTVAFHRSLHFLGKLHESWKGQWGRCCSKWYQWSRQNRLIFCKSLVKINEFLLLVMLSGSWTLWGTLYIMLLGLFRRGFGDFFFFDRWVVKRSSLDSVKLKVLQKIRKGREIIWCVERKRVKYIFKTRKDPCLNTRKML